MPDFNTKLQTEKREKRILRYELLEADNRVIFAVRQPRSIRASFHNAPVDLPPPPNTFHPITHEHHIER